MSVSRLGRCLLEHPASSIEHRALSIEQWVRGDMSRHKHVDIEVYFATVSALGSTVYRLLRWDKRKGSRRDLGLGCSPACRSPACRSPA